MIRVLVVDDSAVVRKVLSQELSRLPDIEVVATATDPYVARELIAVHDPDVITLDLEMPRMDGLSFLDRLMRAYPIPVVVVSSLTPENSETALRALALGAVEVVPKPGSQFSVPDVAVHLARAIRTASTARVQPLTAPPDAGAASLVPAMRKGRVGRTLSTTTRVVAIGASTGGTRAVETVLRALPPDAPGMVIVIHMPAGFTRSFAERLDAHLPLRVREAREGDPVAAGQALVAPGGRHLVLRRTGAHYVVHLKDGPPVHHQRPAVDVLFRSVARHAGGNAVGVLLTGMGADGARGLLEMREAGAHTIAEDESTCIVYGMPRAAVEMGAAAEVLPLPAVGEAILHAVGRRSASAAGVAGIGKG